MLSVRWLPAECVWLVLCFSLLPHSISDSIWLAHGTLLVGSGHQMLLYGQAHEKSNDESLFEHVARLNGPLMDYHPQMLLQCLLWGAYISRSSVRAVTDVEDI